MRPLSRAHPRRWSEALAAGLRCPRDATRQDPRPALPRSRRGRPKPRRRRRRRRPQGRSRRRPRRRRRRADREGGAGEIDRQEGACQADHGRHGCNGRRGNRRFAAAGGGQAAGGGDGHVHDVVVVGAGPSGSSCAYWLADAGWDVVVVEKKVFPREKTCGDGLTPRAVRQLADMGLEDALAGSHRYTGPAGLRLRPIHRDAVAGAPALPRLRLHDHPPRPRRPGGRARAAEAGATLLQGTEVVGVVARRCGPGVARSRP